MNASYKYDDIDSVLAEADELINKLESMVVDDIKEEHRIEFEKCCQQLKSSRSDVQKKITEADGEKVASSYAEGFHEAYKEIVKAMKDLKSLLN